MAQLLVGLDSSDSSTRALHFALDLAGAEQASLLLVHVIQWSPFALTNGEENEHRHVRRQQEIDQARSAVLDPAEIMVAEAGLAAELVIRHGHPAETIIELATTHAVQQVIVGRVGDSRFRQAIFGSLTGQLTQACPVPVTVVP